VQSNRYRSPLHKGERIDLAPADAARYAVAPGDLVRVTSRRGSVVAPVGVDEGLRPGLAFMSFHVPDQVDVNLLTIDATDPKSGTAEFKATAVRVERVEAAEPVAGRGQP
jgi:anaerobic selenocysteine-containing dehydrogenase